jgi:hypothetical protein
MTMTPVNTHGDEIKIPKTITPLGVWIWNAIIFGAFWTVLLWEFGCPTFWSTILTLLGIVISVHYNGITIEGVDYHGFLLFNPLTKKRRVIFPGLHPKLFWESFEEGSLTSLRRIIESEGEQSLPTNDPAENMVAHLTIHKRVNVSGTPQEAASNFIRFHSISDADLAKIVRKEIVRKLSAFYSTNEMEALLNANAIEEAVLSLPAVVDKIREMQYRWGIIIEVVLDSSNPDEATKAMKRTPAMAEALSTAIQKLVAGGMDPELARRAALILDPNTDYTEERFDLNISAPDLKNLQHASFMGFGEGKDKKGGKKK